MSSILKFRFIRYRFGRIEKQYYEKFKAYIYDNLDTVFIKCDDDNEYIWGLYFVPSHEAHKIDAVYSSMHFERIFIPDQYEGTAREACQNLEEQLSQAVRTPGKPEKVLATVSEYNAAVIAGASPHWTASPDVLTCASSPPAHEATETTFIFSAAG